MNWNVNEIMFGSRWSSMCRMGMCVPNTTIVPIDIVWVNFVVGIFVERMKSNSDDIIAFVTNIGYERP